MNPVWHKDTCIKLTAQNKLKAINCSTKLSVVCASDLEEINEGDISNNIYFFLIALLYVNVQLSFKSCLSKYQIKKPATLN
jgi:hypothetical protein